MSDFHVDLASLDGFRSGTLAGLLSRAEALTARMSATSVTGTTYTGTEAGAVGLESHTAVSGGFSERVSLAAQQLTALGTRLQQTADEYRTRDETSSAGITGAGAGIESVGVPS